MSAATLVGVYFAGLISGAFIILVTMKLTAYLDGPQPSSLNLPTNDLYLQKSPKDSSVKSMLGIGRGTSFESASGNSGNSTLGSSPPNPPLQDNTSAQVISSPDSAVKISGPPNRPLPTPDSVYMSSSAAADLGLSSTPRKSAMAQRASAAPLRSSMKPTNDLMTAQSDTQQIARKSTRKSVAGAYKNSLHLGNTVRISVTPQRNPSILATPRDNLV